MTRRALVVDDDRSMVKTLSDVLSLKGWEVTTAFDGESAVQAASRQAFDVVIMDVKMPGMNGVEAFRAMKAKKPELTVVLMTAYAAHELLAQAEREGVLRVLPKPVDIAALFALIEGNLHHKQPVLLIDSDVAFLRTLSEVLRLRGFETLVAEDLDAALRAMEERHPAVVLLHMHLGATSPREAVYAVHGVSPSAALVLYTGRPEAAEQLRQALPPQWVHAYLQKPIAVDKLTGVLNAVAGR